MKAEWKRVEVADICELIVDWVNKTAPLVDGITPYKMLRTTNIKEGRIDRVNCRRVDAETYTKWTRRASVKRGDVILTREAPVGEVGYVDFDDTVFLGQRLMQYRANTSILEPRYLHYSFLSRDLQNQFAAHDGTGSTVSHIRVGDCSRFKLWLPPLPEQRAIAHALGTLDDLIELNRETNEILEEMARTLFKSWFVDFDPVRAKLEGRPPAGMDAATAALFPDHFQDSELGQIPKGWEVGKVSDFASLGRVSVNPGNYASEAFDHYSLPAFDDGCSPKTESGSTIMSNKFLVEPDAVLLSKLNPHIPRVWLPDLSTERRSVCSTEFMVARAIAGASREYLFNLFTNPSFASVYGTLVSGTTGSHQRIGPDSFLAMQIVAPPVSAIKAFTESVKPMFDIIHSNLKESRDLATLRDALLPQLLSGALRVANAGLFPEYV